MTKKELEALRKEQIQHNWKYRMMHHDKFNYKLLNNIMFIKRSGQSDNESWADVIIMADTETSKKDPETRGDNHVVAWTISIRFFDMNIVTLYGHRPDTFVDTLLRIRENITGDHIIVFWHNLPYDWVFIRKFVFAKMGQPVNQLNIKPHYPLFINFENGIQFRDSLMLAQKSLDRWAKDLKVEHQKAKGKWNYEKIRSQSEIFSEDEKEYIEHDTLAGVECIQATIKALNKRIYSLPYTATGILREEVRKRGKQNNAKALFERIAPTYPQYKKLEKLFHGGYTHGNRHLINELIRSLVLCLDFSSSYPFELLSEKYPMEKFSPMKDCKLEKILKSADDTAFMFKLILVKPILKDDFIPMPILQLYKCEKVVNPVEDNGRILCADYVEIYVNEHDAEIIAQQYTYKTDICTEIEFAHKDYLPRWFTDYVYELYEAKCKLKQYEDEDPVSYALAKAKLNSLYGLCVQKSIKQLIKEDYETGEYKIAEDQDEIPLYEKYLENKNNILPFFWGVWVTSAAMKNLFELGTCINADEGVGTSRWIYSDTDSIYSDNWDMEKVNAYNERAKEKLKKNGYGPVIVNDREFWPGIAEIDKKCIEFKVQGAKRYCGRYEKDNKLHITVAGVPKKGAECLEDNINNFAPGFIFPGTVTGKLTHTYFYVDEIYEDPEGNITGDSIDLSPCDYLLNSVHIEKDDWWELFNEEVTIQVYE